MTHEEVGQRFPEPLKFLPGLSEETIRLQAPWLRSANEALKTGSLEPGLAREVVRGRTLISIPGSVRDGVIAVLESEYGVQFSAQATDPNLNDERLENVTRCVELEEFGLKPAEVVSEYKAIALGVRFAQFVGSQTSGGIWFDFSFSTFVERTKAAVLHQKVQEGLDRLPETSPQQPESIAEVRSRPIRKSAATRASSNRVAVYEGDRAVYGTVLKHLETIPGLRSWDMGVVHSLFGGTQTALAIAANSSVNISVIERFYQGELGRDLTVEDMLVPK